MNKNQRNVQYLTIGGVLTVILVIVGLIALGKGDPETYVKITKLVMAGILAVFNASIALNGEDNPEPAAEPSPPAEGGSVE